MSNILPCYHWEACRAKAGYSNDHDLNELWQENYDEHCICNPDTCEYYDMRPHGCKIIRKDNQLFPRSECGSIVAWEDSYCSKCGGKLYE